MQQGAGQGVPGSGVVTGTVAEPPDRRAPERPSYAKDGPSLLWLALLTSFLTVLTLGIYRFWMTTRLRRHYWAAIRIMGDPLEYTGTGLEKLLGFLLAIVILTVFLSLMNLGFAFAGLVQFDDPIALQLAVNLSVLVSLPLIYYATYRARRYVMARTRWRGIRFGMDQAAWGYTGRAVLLLLLTIMTLGVLYPIQHFRLTKYMTDRTWFGDQQFRQTGSWRGLFGYWIWVYAAAVVTAAGVGVIAIAPEDGTALSIGGLVATAGYTGVLLVGLRYRVAAFRYLWSNRRLGEARFANDIDTGEVIGVTIGGSMAAGFSAFLLALIVVGIGAVTWFGVAGTEAIQELAEAIQNETEPPAAAAWPIVVAMGTFYLLLIAFGVAFAQVFLRRPILRRQAEGMMIFNGAALAASRQRSHDQALEAGGFADALGVDLGAGF